ncbi:MAG: hypothetical protein KGI54_13295 [Pseudomonadota bacterium]|nr:hypothetical protein [Pseudomonadota bacterium]
MVKRGADKINQKVNRLKEQFWPEIPDEQLWDRKVRDGFITTPRAMPLMMSIIDDATKGKPAGFAYFALWARSLNECIVEIKDPGSMAYEIGFTGERRIKPWQDRILSLENLGFIKTAPGASGKYSVILLLNPYKVFYQLKMDKKIQEESYNVLLMRAQDIGADDLEEEHKRADKELRKEKQTAKNAK